MSAPKPRLHWSNWVQWLRSHPIYSVAGLLLTGIGIFSDFGTVLNWIGTHAAQIGHAPEHPLFRWAFILAGLGLIGWGVWRSGAKETAAVAEYQEGLNKAVAAFRREIAPLQADLAFNKAIAAAILESRSLWRIWDMLRVLDDRLAAYEEATVEGAVQCRHAAGRKEMLERRLVEAILQAKEVQNLLGIQNLVVDDGDESFERRHLQQAAIEPFDWEVNAVFLIGHRGNHRRLRGLAEKMRQLHGERVVALDRRLGDLSEGELA